MSERDSECKSGKSSNRFNSTKSATGLPASPKSTKARQCPMPANELTRLAWTQHSSNSGTACNPLNDVILF
jgi:hypothetical protein